MYISIHKYDNTFYPHIKTGERNSNHHGKIKATHSSEEEEKEEATAAQRSAGN